MKLWIVALLTPLLASLSAVATDLSPESGTVHRPVTFEASSGRVRMVVEPEGAGRWRVDLAPSGDGRSVRALFQGPGKERSEKTVVFWPQESDKAALDALKEDGIPERSALRRPLMVRVDLSPTALAVYLESRLVVFQPWQAPSGARVDWQVVREAVLGDASKTGLEGRFELAEIPIDAPAGTVPERKVIDGIPFETWPDKVLSLKEACWPDWKRDPAGFNQDYDGGPYFVGDRRMPFFQLPNNCYSDVYLLARSRQEPETTNRLTLRIGRRAGGFGPKSQVIYRDYTAEVPYRDGAPFQLVKVPVRELFPQWVEGDLLDVELTREVRLARRLPDPNSFRWRPLGPPSNVEIAAVTFEKSPLQMKIRFPHLGHVFEQGEPLSAELLLENPGPAPIDYRIEADGGGDWSDRFSGTVKGGESNRLLVKPGLEKLGVYPFRARLGDKAGRPLLEYRTTVGILPPKDRKFRENSPFGVGGGGAGKHFTHLDGAETSELVSRLGFRYLNGLDIPYESRKAFGVRQGTVISMRLSNGGADAILERREERLASHPDQLPQLLIFHEDGISGRHATRVPDLFHDRPPFVLDGEEKDRFEQMDAMARRTAEMFREKHPEVQIQLGNGGLVVREELYKNKFPSALFDSGGNENPSFSRLPETQPPDSIGNNSSLWMDRQMLDHYGYGDKPVTQCHETIYPSTNPGNLSVEAQANYLVRHYLHSLAWKIPQIRGSSIVDKGNSYRNSNWGQTGLFTARPEVAPKPAAVRMAALTKVLDGAVYDGFLDAGSESVYLMRFKLPGGETVLPFWTVRGPRTIHLQIQGKGAVTLVSPDGEASPQAVQDGRTAVNATAAPAYLKLAPDVAVAGQNVDPPGDAPFEREGKVSPLETVNLREWKLLETRNPLLEFYNPLAPRRKGNFRVAEIDEWEGREKVVRIAPGLPEGGKPTMPMYGELERVKPLELPGRPTELGVWVNGNSAWGRVIFELVDASGQQWTSIGARSRKGGTPWMADWLGKELSEKYEPGEKADWNTDDAWGLSRINFDGWRFVGMPLPGNYLGQAYPWPANSQWRWDKDGVVHYPLRVKKIIVELQESVLHLTRYAPPRRPEIYLSGLLAVEDPRALEPRAGAGEYSALHQIQID